jgi:hypothetical protein
MGYRAVRVTIRERVNYCCTVCSFLSYNKAPDHRIVPYFLDGSIGLDHGVGHFQQFRINA